MRDNNTLHDISADLEREFGSRGSEKRKFFENKAWEEYNAQILLDARKNAGKTEREYFTATCANCGKEAQVPFRPREDRPVYCSECYAQLKNQQ